MRPAAFVFDCDGTILDTLDDLVALTNRALADFGMPGHSRQAVLSFVGHGAGYLVAQATPPGTAESVQQEVLAHWRELYPQMGYTFTHPYDGMPEALGALADAGCKLGVVSNKFDAATQHVCEHFFPGVFGAVHGEREGFPRKPDPTGLLRTIAELGATPETTVFVGDSVADMQVAQAAGCLPAAASWGYNAPDVLQEAGAAVLLAHPADLLHLL